MNSTVNYQMFRNLLSYLIETSGKSRTEIAAQTDIRPATLSRYLSGDRTPTLEYAAALADYFGVSIDWLVGKTNDTSELLHLYNIASDDDKLIIDTVLKKYKNRKEIN